MKKFVITEQDRKHILSRHGLLNEQVPPEVIKQGVPPDPYQYKKVGDNKFFYAFKKEGDKPNWIQSKILKGVNAISQNIFKGPEIAKDQAELDKLYTPTGTQSNVTTTTTTIASGAGSGLSGTGSAGAAAAGGGASTTTSQQKQYGRPIMDSKNINVGTIYATFAQKDGVVNNKVNSDNGIIIYCKVNSVKDNVKVNDRVYKLIKATNTETNTPCGSLSFNYEDGWMALIDDKNLVSGGLTEPNEQSSNGYWSYDVPVSRSNEFSLFSMTSQVKGQPGQVTDKFGTRPDISGIQNTQTTTQQGKDTLSNQTTQTNTTQQPVQYSIKDLKDLLKQKGFRVGNDKDKFGSLTLAAIEKALSKQ